MTNLNVGIPLLEIWSQDASVVRQHAVHLALDVRSLGPYGAGAGVQLNLGEELVEQEVATVVPDLDRLVEFVGLVDRVDGLFHLPQVLRGDIVASATELSLEANATGIEWT